MHAHIPNPKFMVWAETSTFGIFRGQNLVAEMSRPKRPRPKYPWPKCPSTESIRGKTTGGGEQPVAKRGWWKRLRGELDLGRKDQDSPQELEV